MKRRIIAFVVALALIVCLVPTLTVCALEGQIYLGKHSCGRDLYANIDKANDYAHMASYWGCACGSSKWSSSYVASEVHTYEDGVCTVCGYECTHSASTNGICNYCGEHVHYKYETITEVAVTCTTDGVKEYYKCDCGKYFSDSACKEEILDVSAWETGDGKIDALGHDYVNIEYSWSGDKCTVTADCNNDVEHKLSETVTGTFVEDVPATCLEFAKGHYLATFDVEGVVLEDQETEKESATGTTKADHVDADSDYKCDVCGCDMTKDYKIIEGQNQEVKIDIDKNAKFRSDAPFADFIEVQVDGKIVAPSNYKASEGSTIIELLPSFLKTLSVGKHTLAIVSKGGSANTNFTIVEEEVIENTDMPLGFVSTATVAMTMAGVTVLGLGLVVLGTKKERDAD